MNGENYYDQRLDFAHDSLLETEVAGHPLEQLQKWIKQAIELEDVPTAMVLATSTFEGKPSTRTVLIKRIDAQGIYFYSNYESKKGKQLLQNPFASGCFFWPNLERQVVLEGQVRRLEAKESDAYFKRCDETQKLAAWAFPQSQTVTSRKYVETLLADFKEDYQGSKEIPRPDNWGGYLLNPEVVEFWQGRANLAHDRLQYTLFNGEWKLERLAP